MSASHLRLVFLLQRGRHEELESASRELLAGSLEDATAWIFLCRALVGQNRLAAAEEAARKAVTLEPEADSGFYLLALVLLERNQPKQALAAAREAIRLDSEDSQNYAIAARALNGLGRHAEAAAMAQAGLVENADCDGCLFQLGQAQSMLGRHEDADKVTRTLLEGDPEDSANHCARGYHLLLAGNAAAARQHFLEALRLQPDNSDAREGLAQSLSSRNPLFRWMLRFSVLCARQGWKAFAVAMGGFWLLVVELPKRTKELPGAAVPVSVLLAVAALLMVLVISHRSISTLMLLAHRETRFVVSRDERRPALWSLPLLLMAAVCLFSWFYTGGQTGGLRRFPGELFVWPILTTLVWEVYDATNAWVRRRMAWITAVSTALIIGASVLSCMQWRHVSSGLAALTEDAAWRNLPKEEKAARLKEMLSPRIRAMDRIRLLIMAVLLAGMFSENLREFLERRAPDPD